MTVPFLSREEVRTVDEIAINRLGIPGLVLMENAGKNSAALLSQLGIQGKVTICCGKGNNGGDGFVIARHLAILHHEVEILLCADPEQLSSDAAVNYLICRNLKIPLQTFFQKECHYDDDVRAISKLLNGADWIVDALLGTGLTGAPRSPLDEIISLINRTEKQILAIDVPSGLDCNTGLPLGKTVKANQTVTFVAAKQGFEVNKSRQWTGTVHVVDIGLPSCIIDLVK